MDTLPGLCENSFSKLGAVRIFDLRYFSNLLLFCHQVSEPFRKPFDSQQILGLKIVPD